MPRQLRSVGSIAAIFSRFVLLGIGFVAPRVSADVVISEFMAANVTTLADADGDFPDWIELHNSGLTDADLTGWFLTDRMGQPGRWMFPATNLAAGARLLVFASGKDRRIPGQSLHTSFKLSSDGEYLALVDPNGNVVSALGPALPRQRPDVSYGLVGNTGTNGFLSSPTPGAANAVSIAEFVADTKFSHDRGFYEAGFNLVISCATPGATVYYTTNGSAPDSNNLQRLTYAAPIPITGTTTLRARAEKSGARASDIDTHTYLFLHDVAVQSTNGAAPPGWPASPVNGQVFDYGMDPDIVAVPPGMGTVSNALRAIPSVSVVLDLNDLVDPSTGIYVNATENGRAWERPVSIELLRPGAPRDGFQLNAGLRIRGNFSRSGGNPKHSFHVVCRDDYGPARLHYPLFGDSGAPVHERFDLRTAQDDSFALAGSRSATYLADPFSRDTQLALGQPGERGDWYHLYLNGQYWGLYNSCERPDAGFAASYFGGDEADYDVLKASPEGGNGTMEVVDGDDGAWTRLWQAARAGFAGNAAYFKVQGRNADGSVNPGFENLLDVTNLVDYLLTVIYTGNIDGPIYLDLNTGTVNNYFAFRNQANTGGFRFMAHDAELSLLDVTENRTGTSTLGSSGPGLMNPHYLASRLRANAEFKTLFADRVQRHFFNGGALTPAATAARFSARTNELHQAITGESARWGDFANNTRNNPITRSNWLNGVARVLQNYFPNRSAIVLDQLRAEGLFPSLVAPSFSMAAGEVAAGSALSLSNANASGVVYYTLDGADPRAIGGVVHGTAVAGAAPIVITRSQTIRARVKSGATWSPLVEAIFRPAQDFSGLRISEIMFHPPVDGVTSGDEFEFLELKNTGESMLDLGGLFFGGIGFTFTNGTRLAPGAFFVLGRNAALLGLRYPGLIPNGLYAGRLANDGERITLHAAGGGEILSVNFRDDAPWPAAADGHGFSIVPANLLGTVDPDNGLSWRASASVGGSPAADDPSVPNRPPVVINEVLTHTDLPDLDVIELFNPTGSLLDLGGWYLTDDRSVPRKFRIPDGTFIAPGGYRSFSEDDFGQGPAAFALDSTGDDVCLFSGTLGGTNLTGYSHTAQVGAAANGVSFGRVLNSRGEERFVALESLTIGAANSLPRIGPAVLNEVHYHPAPGDDAFVEIVNISGAPLDLFDALHPTNTWRVAGVDFTLPAGVTLPAGGLVLIVGTDPAAFRDKYSVSPDVPVLGPFRGALQNNGERLELQRPDTPNTNGLPYITVDAVRYGDRAPWPVAADGDGSSLQRLVAGSYGDDATNWFASGLTPGQTNRPTLGPSISGQPLSQSVIPGSDVEFVVAALGDAPAFQWRFNAAPIPGATSATLFLTNVTSVDAGLYDAVVSDGNGSSTSLVATLTVECPFALVEESVTIGSGGGTFAATLVAPAGCVWTIEGMRPWVTTASANGSGGGGIVFNVPANPGPSIRSATLTIGGLPFVVTQSPPDSVRPTLKVNSPAAGTRNDGATVRVSGTAGDNVAVERVEFAIGTNVFSRAGGTTSWAGTATLAPGTNHLMVRAVDLEGNFSVTDSRVVFRVLPVALSLAKSGAGAVSGPTNGQMLEIGRAYTLEARPGSGSVFSNWTGSVASSAPQLGFVMTSNFAVTANFVPNPFAAVAGRFHGLFHDLNAIQHETSGGFTLSLTTRGTYSATLQGGGFRLSASGRFDLAGSATNSIGRPGASSLTVRWQVALGGSDTLSGDVSDGVWTAGLEGDRAVFSRANPCGFAGRYTMAWPGLPGDEFVPGGSSFATVSINSNGAVRLGGSLADGTALAHAGQVSRQGHWPLHTPLYARRGSIFSWLEFADRAADDFHGVLNWSKPPVPGARFYPGGFATNLTEAAGARYSSPSGTNRILSLVDAELVLVGGNLTAGRTNRFGLGFGSRATNHGPDHLSLVFTTGNGRFKGSIRPTNSAAFALGGVVLQKAVNGAGFFTGTNQSGTVVIRANGDGAGAPGETFQSEESR